MKVQEKARSKAAGGQGDARIQNRRHGHGCPGKIRDSVGGGERGQEGGGGGDREKERED